MKNIFFSLLARVLKAISRGIIRKYKPLIIGVTGSAGKTSAKEAIYVVLKDFMNCRMSRGNFNNEIGFPLAVIGDYDSVKGKMFWLKVVFDGLKEFVSGSAYPKVLILEYAADKPGDIAYLLSIARPDVAVVTGVSKTPVHVSNYGSPEAVAREKRRLIEALSGNGVAVLNADDEVAAGMIEYARGRFLTYGTSGVDVRIVDFVNVFEDGRPEGSSFKLETIGKLLPVHIQGSLGKAQAYACAAALAVASALGVNLVRGSEKLSGYRMLPGRMKIIRGAEDSWIIDDTYNASPFAMIESLNTLKSVKARRKIAVLGDMKELGEYSDEAHKEMGRLAAASADVLLAIGEKGKIIAESAIASGMDGASVHVFDDSNEAKVVARDMVSEGDLFLIKGSQSMRMERVTKELMAEPEKARELLVRQYGKWLES